MSNLEDGGAAFPSDNVPIIDDATGIMRALGKSQGMTLRDYFAAKAMQGMIAGYMSKMAPQMKGIYAASEIVPDAYAYADMMLKERAK